MKCVRCETKVNVRNIRRVGEEIFCKSCAPCEEKSVEVNEEFCKLKDELFAKAIVYTYALLYKEKMIS